MKKAKTVKGKSSSPEEGKKGKEQKAKDQKEKDQRVTMNLEKQREKERFEKLEKERKALMEDKEKEKERLILEKLEKEKEDREKKLKERELKRIDLTEMKEARRRDDIKEYERKEREMRDKAIQEWTETEKLELARIASLKNKYEKLLKEGCSDMALLDKARKEWEVADAEQHKRARELKMKLERKRVDMQMELSEILGDITMEFGDVYPYSTSASGSVVSSAASEIESEGEEVTAEVTMVEKSKEKDDYDGIHYMREIIKEVEVACSPGPSGRKTEVEESLEVGEEVKNDEYDFENMDIGDLTKCDNLVQVALDIQEAVVEITTSKECRKEVGRSIRKEVRNLIELIIKQQKSLVFYKAKYEERNKQVIIEEKVETYADKLKKKNAGVEGKSRSRSRSRQKPLYSVSVYPVDEITSEDITKDMMKYVDINNLKGGVRKVRNIRKGGIIVDLDEKEDIDRLIEEINGHMAIKDKYKAAKTTKRSPQIVIFNVPEEIEEDEMKKEIVERNSCIKGEEDFIIRKHYRGRFGNNWVLEIKPEVFKILQDQRKIRIRWMSHDYKENLRPTFCFSCGRPGHIARVCRNENICIKCGSKDHLRGNCTNKEVNCVNCIYSNKVRGTKYDVKHSCFDRTCTFYQRECDRLSQITDYYE